MPDLFISYARADQRYVDLLTARFERAQLSFWLDRRDLPPSLPWMEEIKDAIAASVLFVVVDTDRWRTSVHCRAEEALARAARLPSIQLDSAELSADQAVEIVRAARHDDEHGRVDAAAIIGRPARLWNRMGRPWSQVPYTIDFWIALLGWFLHRDVMPPRTGTFLSLWGVRLLARGVGSIVGLAAIFCLGGSFLAILVMLYIAARAAGLG